MRDEMREVGLWMDKERGRDVREKGGCGRVRVCPCSPVLVPVLLVLLLLEMQAEPHVIASPQTSRGGTRQQQHVQCLQAQLARLRISPATAAGVRVGARPAEQMSRAPHTTASKQQRLNSTGAGAEEKEGESKGRRRKRKKEESRLTPSGLVVCPLYWRLRVVVVTKRRTRCFAGQGRFHLHRHTRGTPV